jgi:hypothetical protein
MKLVMHRKAAPMLPIVDADGKLVGWHQHNAERMEFIPDDQERALLEPGMLFRVEPSRFIEDGIALVLVPGTGER